MSQRAAQARIMTASGQQIGLFGMANSSDKK
jgi:hypothetical protein